MTRAVLVTGGAAGIGWATAQRFAAAGDRVMIADIDAAAAEARAATLGPAHAAIGADVARPETAERVVAACRARFGRLDVLVNNAGVIDSGGTMITDQPLDAFRRLLAINLLGMERMSLAAHAVMRSQAPYAPDAAQGVAAPPMNAPGWREAPAADLPRGVIVNLASGAAFRAIPLRNGYSASKAGVVAMTRAFGVAWAREGIRVNALAPGYIRTDLVAELIAKGRVDPARVERRVPLGRMGRPEEMAACIHFLAGPGAAGMAGGVLIADGASAVFGAADDAAIRRGADPRAAPPGRPAVVVAGADTALGAACLAGLPAHGFDVAGVAAGDAAGVEAAARRFGRLDALVNAAGTDAPIPPAAPPGGRETGGASAPGSEAASGTAAAIERQLEAQFLAGQGAGRVMLAQGYGAVVNLTGIGGLAAGLGPPGDGIADAAVGMLTRSMACEWGGSGIRANALAVCPLAPASAAGRFGAALPGRRLPTGRPITPASVVAAVAFLLSPDSGYVSGAIVALDGGASHYAGPDLTPSQAIP